MEFLIYVNVTLAVLSFLFCVAYIVKHKDTFKVLFIWKAFVTGAVMVLYILIASGYYKSEELIEHYRVAWTLQLMIPIAMTIALWNVVSKHE